MPPDSTASDVIFEGPVAFNEADLLDSGAVDSYAHNVLLVHELVGALDLDRLSAAYRWLGERHESFRSSFVRTPEGWRRRVHGSSRFGLETIDLSGASDAEAEARARISALFRTPFDRGSGPLLRVLLFRLGAERQWVVNLGDHLVMDGLSFTAALREVLVAYVSLASGQLPALSPPRQPREHTEAVNALLSPLKVQGGPWEVPYPDDGFRLRPDPSCPGGTDPAGARTIVALGSTAAIDSVSGQLGVSRSAPFLVAMAAGLRAVAERTDVGFTLIRSGRRDAAAHGIVGCLAWGDAWAVDIADGDTWASVLTRAHAFVQDGHPGRMLTIPTVNPPTRRLVLNVNRFDTTVELPGFTAFPRADVATDVVMWQSHDLLVQVFPIPGMTLGVIRYRTALIEPATAARFGAAMTSALTAMTLDPHGTVPRLFA